MRHDATIPAGEDDATSGALVPSEARLPSTLTDSVERARGYAENSRAAATRRAYASDVRAWVAWCRSMDLVPWPVRPETVALYLADHADRLKPSTLDRRLYALVQSERASERTLDTRHPAIRDVRAGIRRARGVAPSRKAPTTTDDIRRMIAALPDALIGLRDRALLLVGFAGALRRSELATLEVADLAVERDGLVVTVRRSKGDQEGEGARVGLPYGSSPLTCPVRAVEDWLTASGIRSGRLFRSVSRHGRVGESITPDAVAPIVKRACRRIGLDPAGYAGHSLRAGFATSAAANGAQERDIARQTRHRSMVVLRGYIRDANLFRDSAAARLGL